MLGYVIGVTLFVTGLCLSLALHEAGHLLSARAFGMRVRRYFVGRGPTVFSFRSSGTEYGLKALPIGRHGLLNPVAYLWTAATFWCGSSASHHFTRPGPNPRCRESRTAP